MIEVSITDSKGELAKIRIENTKTYDDKTADYSIQFAVDRFEAIGLHQRAIYRFPREEVNVLGLLLAALSTLDESELELEPEVSNNDLSRKQIRAPLTF